MTDDLDKKMSYSPFAEDRKQTIAEKVTGKGLKLAPTDVGDQEAARRAGALDRPAPEPDSRDDDLVSSNPADQRDELLAETRRKDRHPAERR